MCDPVGHKTRNSGPNTLKALHISFSLRDPQTRYHNTHLIEIKKKKVQRYWGIYWNVERFTKQLVAGLAFKCKFIWLENPHWYLRYTFWRPVMSDKLKRMNHFILTFIFQFSSVAQSCPTLCDPMNHSTLGLPVHHQLPEFIQTHVHGVGDTTQPSHPLLSLSLPALNVSQHQGLLKWVSSSHQVAKGLEF